MIRTETKIDKVRKIDKINWKRYWYIIQKDANILAITMTAIL